jgi:hypothetical protein
LRAELWRKGIDVCQRGTGAPIAVVELVPSSSDSVEVVVDVQDAVTRKRVSRALDLRATPMDARPLAIAVGTDELLVASWVEVAVHEPPAGTRPPEAVRRAVAKEVRRAPAVELSVAPTFETYGGGQRLLGIDVRGAVWASPRLAFTLRLGPRRGLEDDSVNGAVRANAWVFGLGAKVPLTSPERPFGLDALGRLDALFVSYSADATNGAVGHPGQATAVVGSAGISARVDVASFLRFAVEGSLGTPFRTVTATDTGTKVAAIDGLLLALGCEAGLVF